MAIFARKKTIPGPPELLFMLMDSCMHMLSPNAWKVVCYVAVQQLRVHTEWLERVLDPGTAAMRSDFEKVEIYEAPAKSGERSYRRVDGCPCLPGERTSRFVVISLRHFCIGVRDVKRRRRDFGTGLSKSSVAAAIKEGVQSGILVQRRNKSGAGRDLASLYGIDWDRVQELDWARRKNLKMVPGSAASRKSGSGR